MRKSFVIVGPPDPESENGDLLYWSNQDGWVSFESATHFDRNEIFFLNPPMGCSGIMELTPDNCLLHYFKLIAPPTGGGATSFYADYTYQW